MRETIINLPGLAITSFAFRRRLVDVSDAVHAEPDYLATVIKFESEFQATARNPHSGATGLIQFLESTAHRLGTSTAALAQMTDVEQLDFVEKYMAPFAGRLQSLGDTYFAVFYPAAIGKAMNHVLFSKGEIAYSQNIGFDPERTGLIDCGDVMRPLLRLYHTSSVLERLPVDDQSDTEPAPPPVCDDEQGGSGNA